MIKWYKNLSPAEKEWLHYALIIVVMAILPVLGLLLWRVYDRWNHPEFYLLFLPNLYLTFA